MNKIKSLLFLATLTVASVPSVLSGATPAATVTQVPTIQNTNLIITREC